MTRPLAKFTPVALICAWVSLTGVSSLEALFAPSAKLWPQWTAHDPAATHRIRHDDWDRLLKTYLRRDDSGIHRFAYGAVSPADSAALDQYIDGLVSVPISRFNRAQQQAFWINLYNALTVKVVLAHYPEDSILDIDISPGLFADGPWDKELVQVENTPLSLNDIEHRILRPIWQDPRIHYAVNCASLGCPNLQADAFTAENSEQLLDFGARMYINHPRGATVTGGRLKVSSIYVWFAEDFGGSDSAIIDHLKRYAEPALAAELAAIASIDDHDYDWRLNDAGG